MSKQTEKRMIGDTGYEVRQVVRVGIKEIALAENLNAKDGMFYLVCDCISMGLVERYDHGLACDDYLEAMQIFLERVQHEVSSPTQWSLAMTCSATSHESTTRWQDWKRPCKTAKIIWRVQNSSCRQQKKKSPAPFHRNKNTLKNPHGSMS